MLRETHNAASTSLILSIPLPYSSIVTFVTAWALKLWYWLGVPNTDGRILPPEAKFYKVWQAENLIYKMCKYETLTVQFVTSIKAFLKGSVHKEGQIQTEMLWEGQREAIKISNKYKFQDFVL